MLGREDAEIAKILASMKGVDLAQSPDFPPEVNERIPLTQANAERNLAKVGPELKANAERLLGAALNARTAAQRVMWLNRAADAMANGFGPHSACRDGCAHCCHIPVVLSLPEARAMAKATGRALNEDAGRPMGAIGTTRSPAESIRSDFTSPCPFLEGKRCSAYAQRSAVCRAHINLDVDDLLCRPVPGAGVPVPYLNVNAIHMANVEMFGLGPYADIREWFPPQ